MAAVTGNDICNDWLQFFALAAALKKTFTTFDQTTYDTKFLYSKYDSLTNTIKHMYCDVWWGLATANIAIITTE